MKLCIDPGHGMANRSPGVYDSGCVGNGLEEADVVLVWGEELRRSVEARGIQTFMTRRDKVTPVSVGARVQLARDAGCTHFLSLHVNDAENPEAHGIETLYNGDNDFALEVQAAAIACLGLRDRGVKFRNDLAVLKFPGTRALLELGFIKSDRDVKAFTNNALMLHTCRMLAQIF